MPTNGDRDHVQRLKRGHDSVATRKARDAPWRARRPQPGARARVHAQLPWEIRKLNMQLSIERVRLKLTDRIGEGREEDDDFNLYMFEW
jgi:hypothetical protein